MKVHTKTNGIHTKKIRTNDAKNFKTFQVNELAQMLYISEASCSSHVDNQSQALCPDGLKGGECTTMVST